jgi:hypothetical protein
LKIRPASWVALASSVLLLGTIFMILHKQQTFSDLPTIWQRSNRLAIGLAALVMLGVQLVAAMRLKTIMRADGLSRMRLLSVFRIQLISLFAAHGAPISALADVARATMLKLRFGLSMGRAGRLVAYDRICGALGAAIAGLVAACIQYGLPGAHPLLRTQFLLWIGSLMGTAVLLCLGGTHAKTRFDVFNRIVRAVIMLGEMLAMPSVAVKLTLNAVAQLLGFSTVCIVLAFGMHIHVSPLQVVLYMPLIFFVSALPIFYLGWGAREAIFIATLGSAGGISSAEAVALSLGIGVMVFLASLPGAMFWLLRPSMRKQIADAGGALPAPDVGSV